jgi:hypothetical protein
MSAARDRLRAALDPLDGEHAVVVGEHVVVDGDQIAELIAAARELLDDRTTQALLSVVCCLCMHARLTANAATTIINGQAVCDEHAGYVQGGDFASYLSLVIAQEGGRPH